MNIFFCIDSFFPFCTNLVDQVDRVNLNYQKTIVTSLLIELSELYRFFEFSPKKNIAQKKIILTR